MARDVASLRDAVAQLIFLHEGGLSPEDYVQVYGRARRLWQTDAQWDSQPEVELCEHERDEYRTQADAVLQFLRPVLAADYAEQLGKLAASPASPGGPHVS